MPNNQTVQPASDDPAMDPSTLNVAQQPTSPNAAEYVDPNNPAVTSSGEGSQTQYEDPNNPPANVADAETFTITKQEREKYAKLESDNAAHQKKIKELEKLTEDSKQYQQTVDLLNEAFAEDRETYDKVADRIRKKGYVVPTYEEAFAIQQQQQQQGVQNPNAPTTSAQPTSVEDIKASVKQDLMRDMQVESELKEFAKEVPELAPIPTDPDEVKSQKMQTFETVNRWAFDLMKGFPGQYSYKEALVEAYYSLPQNRQKAIERAAKIGEMTGQAVKNANSVTTSANPVGGGSAPTAPADSKPTAEDTETAKRWGITPEAAMQQRIRNRNLVVN